MDWLMYVAFMPFLMPLVIIGVGMTGVEIFKFLRRNPRLGRSEPTKALGTTFLVIAVSLLILFLPRFVLAFSLFKIISAIISIWYFGCAVYFMWKWGRVIVAMEDGDPSNDPHLPGKDKCTAAQCACSCHAKK
ncbi:MAG: hypothetical protein IT343_07240 [Candidatus Melainabacteria bacterium]|jgi:uncharacterized membrane protein YidH (DUF202 family)|nr:hypothetical protein [Candidatus Melainabacteria bacterium]